MNPILTKIKEAVAAKYPKFAQVLTRAEHAGQQVMFSSQTRKLMLAQLGQNPSDPEVIGAGIAKLIGILYSESENTLPPQVFGPLSTLLLCDGLDFLEEAGKVQVTPDFVAQCQQALSSSLMQMLGVTPERMQQMVQQAQARQAGGAAPGAPAQPAPAAPGGIVGGAMQPQGAQ